MAPPSAALGLPPSPELPKFTEPMELPPARRAADFLTGLGFGPEATADPAPLRGLGEHLRENELLRREVDDLRARVHSEALAAQSLDARRLHLEARLGDELRETARLSNTLEATVAEYRTERARALREKTELVKQCARLRGLDSNHLANFRRLEADHDKLRDKVRPLTSRQPRRRARICCWLRALGILASRAWPLERVRCSAAGSAVGSATHVPP